MSGGDNNGGLGLTFKRDGRYILLAGRIDEFAEYAPLLTMDPPLRLVMRDVRALNSHGIRKWIQFVRAWGLKQIEFHECPAVFIDAVNMIGDLVSATGNMKRVKSVQLPVHCDACNASGMRVLPLTDVLFKNEDEVSVRLAPCARCKRVVSPLVALGDYLWFMQADDKPKAP